MDKVKIVLDVLKKHHFWALIGLVLLLGLSIYITAAHSLQRQYDQRAGALRTAWESADGITRKTDHPNDPKIVNLENMKRQQENEVKEAWLTLYRGQKKSNPWPPVLGAEFLAMIGQSDDPEMDIPPRARETYRNNIENALPKLLGIVDFVRDEPIVPGEAANGGPADGAAPTAPPGAAGNMMGVPGQPNTKQVGTVVWDPADQARITTEFNFGNMVPSSKQVRLTQENYWVYQALLTIIRKTNGDVATRAGAAIKQIMALEIGQKAVASMGNNRPSVLGSSATTGATTGGSVSDMNVAPPAVPAGMQPVGAATGPAAPGAAGSPGSDDAILLNSRYVNEKMEPVQAGQNPYPEFNMMPVRMVLVIDQRKIPELLVQCVSSSMPVEPVQLRINPGKLDSGGSGLGGGMMGMGMGMGMGMDAGMGGERMPGGQGMGMPGGGAGGSTLLGTDSNETSPYEVTLELRGIIYIYNRPPEGSQETAGQPTGAAAASPSGLAPSGAAPPGPALPTP